MNNLSDFQETAYELSKKYGIIDTILVKDLQYVCNTCGFFADSDKQIDIESDPWKQFVISKKIGRTPTIENVYDIFYKEFDVEKFRAVILGKIIKIEGGEFRILKGSEHYFLFSKLYCDLYADYENCEFAVKDGGLYMYSADYSKVLFVIGACTKIAGCFS